MEKIILGLVGRKQVGKDTVADYLIEHENFTQIAFADTLREVAYGTNPLVSVDPPLYYADVIDSVGYEAGKRDYPEFRRFLQNLGTNGIRRVEPDFWIKHAINRIQETPGHVVVTDVRFPNELAVIESLGGWSARIFRPGYSDVPAEHESESALDDAETDYTIRNDSSLLHLQDKTALLHKSILFDKRVKIV